MTQKRSKQGLTTEPATPGSRDVALIRGRTADGEGLSVIRQRDDQVEFGAVRPLKEGAPIHGEVVTLKPRPEFPLLCDVDVAYSPPEQAADVAKRSEGPRRGPAQVASESYRTNWDAIWSRPAKKRELVN
jgi:hypothetical protein